MTLPTAKMATLGIQEIIIYPWNGGAGPFDQTTAETLSALQYADIAISAKLAKYFGGEAVGPQGAAEVERDTTIKLSAVSCTLRGISLLTGDDLVVDPANGNGKEAVNMADSFGGRAGFVRVVTKSRVGTGILEVTYAKCMLEGSINYSQKMDAWHIPELPLTAFYDSTFVRKDGTTGATYQWFYGDGGTTGLHS